MTRLLLFTSILAALNAHGATPAVETQTIPGSMRAIYYAAAHRVIRLADGSDFVLREESSPRERRSVLGVLISSEGKHQDRAIRIAFLLTDEEMAAETSGQIYSVAMSDDHQWIALVGGWMGANDRRGHNGVFLLKKSVEAEGLVFWKLHSWFDVKGMMIGEVEFGPDDLLLVTSHDENNPQPIVTLYSWSGQNLGAWLASEDVPQRRAWATHKMRFTRLGGSSYALYDPEAMVVRFFDVLTGDKPRIVERHATPVTVDAASNVLAAHARADRSVSLLHTDAAQGGRTIVTTFAADGTRTEEWSAKWQRNTGYFDGDRAHTFLALPGKPVERIAVDLR